MLLSPTWKRLNWITYASTHFHRHAYQTSATYMGVNGFRILFYKSRQDDSPSAKRKKELRELPKQGRTVESKVAEMTRRWTLKLYEGRLLWKQTKRKLKEWKFHQSGGKASGSVAFLDQRIRDLTIHTGDLQLIAIEMVECMVSQIVSRGRRTSYVSDEEKQTRPPQHEFDRRGIVSAYKYSGGPTVRNSRKSGWVE